MAEAQTEVDERIKLLRNNYLEMYAAAVQAFPLQACLRAASAAEQE